MVGYISLYLGPIQPFTFNFQTPSTKNSEAASQLDMVICTKWCLVSQSLFSSLSGLFIEPHLEQMGLPSASYTSWGFMLYLVNRFHTGSVKEW